MKIKATKMVGKILSDFDDPIMLRNNRKPVWINRYLNEDLLKFAESQGKDPRDVAEYLISVGLNSSECHQNIIFDFENL